MSAARVSFDEAVLMVHDLDTLGDGRIFWRTFEKNMVREMGHTIIDVTSLRATGSCADSVLSIRSFVHSFVLLLEGVESVVGKIETKKVGVESVVGKIETKKVVYPIVPLLEEGVCCREARRHSQS